LERDDADAAVNVGFWSLAEKHLDGISEANLLGLLGMLDGAGGLHQERLAPG
jgi:hypothetical protein